MITRDLINKNIKYSEYDSTDIVYNYAYLSREIDRFKNILLKYKAEPGMTVYNFLRGVNCVALFFACSELGIITALTDVTWQTMKMYFDKRDYKVNFSKIKRLKIKKTISIKKGIKEIINFIKSSKKKNFNNKIYYNHK